MSKVSSMFKRSISLLSQELCGWSQKRRGICTLLRCSKYVKASSSRTRRNQETRGKSQRFKARWNLSPRCSNLNECKVWFCFLGGQVHILPSNVSLEQGALCEPLSCILHGWHRLKITRSVQAQSKILILGAGIIGNLWSCLLHHFGHRKVIVSEPSLERRMITEGLGKYKIQFESVKNSWKSN